MLWLTEKVGKLCKKKTSSRSLSYIVRSLKPGFWHHREKSTKFGRDTPHHLPINPRSVAHYNKLWLMIYGIFNFYWVATMANPVGVIHVQYYPLDSIGKNRSSIRPICSIWRIEKFLDDATSSVFYPTIDLISESDPLQVCRFSRFVLFGEWKMLFMTRPVEFRFV